MPRIRQNAQQYARDDFLREVRVRMAYLNIPCNQDLADLAGIPNSTLTGKLKEPDKLTVDQLRRIVQVIDPDPEVLLKFLGSNRKKEV